MADMVDQLPSNGKYPHELFHLIPTWNLAVLYFYIVCIVNSYTLIYDSSEWHRYS